MIREFPTRVSIQILPKKIFVNHETWVCDESLEITIWCSTSSYVDTEKWSQRAHGLV